jgi:group I intron endonuclease
MNKGIYKITNLKNNKVYIGQSENLNNREWNHFYWLGRGEHHNEHLQKSYNKYGRESFIFEVIEYTDDLDNRELHWINECGGVNSELNYNLKDPTSKEWSDYVRVKQSKKMLGENNPNFGNKWTDEQKEMLSKRRKGLTLEERIGVEKAKLAKQKMSKSQTGRKHPNDVKEKIRQANVGENNPAYGMGDRQRGDKNPMYGKPSSKRKPIQQFTKEGVFIKEYEFLSQVMDNGFNASNVCTVANGRLKSTGGFIWRYK